MIEIIRQLQQAMTKAIKKKCITFLYKDGNGNSIVIFYITEKTIN